MNHVLFTVGWCPSESEYVGLQDYIKKFYTPKLPAGTNFMTARWNENVAAQKFNVVQPTDKLVLVGFSFGGQKTVEIAGLSPVKPCVILIDPVDYNKPTTPNTNGFYLPPSVKRAWCFYRWATQSPWSGYLRGGPVEFSVKEYTPKPGTIDAQHGQYVWEAETINAIKTALTL